MGLLPWGYLTTEDRYPFPQSATCRQSTGANPSPDESTLLDDEDDEIIYWFWDPSQDQVSTFQSTAQCDPGVSPEQDTQSLMLAHDQLVESSPSVQRVDYLHVVM